ncbi:hypothetical protein AGMMS50229_01990 [Campylobacterota bacterium]|nr:hypothetical protein AGMMS50229_01990 [Campylobacterota bacterium]
MSTVEALEAELSALKIELAQKDEIILGQIHIDKITGLENRVSLAEQLSSNENIAIIFIDICRFGLINAVYGPEVGDYVLRQTAEALRRCKSENAQLFRFAGDEFAFMLTNPAPHQGEHLAEFIMSFIAQSHIFYGEVEIKLSVTVGIAYGSDTQVLSQAMIALQDAKSKGCGRCTTYSKELESYKRQESNLYWIPRVRQAIEDEAIEPWFQPIVNNQTGAIDRYECLARLRDERGKIIDPYYFLEAAEVSGILTSITKTIIARSFKYFEDKNTHFSINITDNDLQEEYLCDMLAFRLKKHKLLSSQVTIEIVESVSASAVSRYTDQLLALKQMGFLIAVDDFGSEHSNFSRLLSIDLDFIKIDGVFLRNLVRDKRSQIVVRNIVEFARSFGAKTIAEYVSTKAIFELSKSFGVDYSQGYLFGKPQPTIEMFEANMNEK